MASINTSMCRGQLARQGQDTIRRLDNLIARMRAKRVQPSTWHGTIENDGCVGEANRGPCYVPICERNIDDRWPWFVYWEIWWLLRNTPLAPGAKVLDVGGTASLMSCLLASEGYEVCSIDLNDDLRKYGEYISRVMDWPNLMSYAMDASQLEFPRSFFDACVSVCTFEHMPYRTKQAALHEIATVLKPGGLLSITFDFRNPAPAVVGIGPDTSEENRLSTPEDVERSFCGTGLYHVRGNYRFYDNGESYLVHPRFGGWYTFGSLFLRRPC